MPSRVLQYLLIMSLAIKLGMSEHYGGNPSCIHLYGTCLLTAFRRYSFELVMRIRK